MRTIFWDVAILRICPDRYSGEGSLRARLTEPIISVCELRSGAKNKTLAAQASGVSTFSPAFRWFCFANAAGGTLLIGIEDDAAAPPAEQRVDPAVLDRIRKRVGELTVNTHVVPELKTHANGGEYIELAISRAVGVASTSDGRYFLRVGDTCRPLTGDDVLRLANERPLKPWEEMTSLRITDAAQIKPRELKRWLRKSRTIQWDYKNIVKRRGVLEKIGDW